MVSTRHLSDIGGGAARNIVEIAMYMHYYTTAHDARSVAAQARQRAWQAPVDIREEKDRYLILADLPGVDPQAITVEMDGRLLTIRAERATAGGDGRYSRIERRGGVFSRRFALPEDADLDAIVASGRNGVLELSISKKSELAPRRIQVGVRALESETASGEDIDARPAQVQ